MEIHLPRIQSGDLLTANHINAPSRALEQLRLNIGPGSGLGYSESSKGMSLWVVDFNIQIWAKITSGSNPYAWTEQQEQANGTWIDAPRTGTITVNQAYESNGNATVPVGKIVLMSFSQSSNVWSFTYGQCT